MTLRAAGAVVALQALGTLAFGAWMIAEATRSRAEGAGLAWSTALLVAGCGIVLGFLAYALVNGRAWTRGLLVVLEIVALPIGWQFLPSPTTAAGVATLASAVVVLALVFAPASTAVFVEHGGRTARDRDRVRDRALARAGDHADEPAAEPADEVAGEPAGEPTAEPADGEPANYRTTADH